MEQIDLGQAKIVTASDGDGSGNVRSPTGFLWPNYVDMNREVF